jgi:hypothetical protein
LAVSTVRYVAWQSAPTDVLFAQYTVQTVALFQAAPLAVLIRYLSVLGYHSVLLAVKDVSKGLRSFETSVTVCQSTHGNFAEDH